MSRFKTLDDLDVAGKRVLVRVDFNVPMRDGRVRDATRIERSLPTIEELVRRGGRVVLMSHFGRPKGRRIPGMSLHPVAEALSTALGGRPVDFAADCVGAPAEAVVAGLSDGGIALLENLRFHAGEAENDPGFAAALAQLGDLYVNDAFSAAHRAHASVEALTRLLPAAAGRLMQAELEHLTAAVDRPARPLAIILGGAKISTKLDLLGNLVEKADLLALGGAMANTFLNALGVGVGRSLCEHDMAEAARAIVGRAKAAACDLVLPTDAVIAPAPEAGIECRTVSVKQVPAEQMILDVGPATAAHLGRCLETCGTLVWNGPLGCFEVPPFDAGTKAVARKAADLTRAGRLRTVAGGGDTVAALGHAGVADCFSYVTTAGGAFFEWLEGKTLPGVAALEAAA
ncbi:MAG: phosphoglycerate kinase [Kiloniellaceae bacterium]